MEKHSVACIVLDGRSILIARRNPVGQMGGRWEFPGGKREPGESDGDAVIREFLEEFGVQVRAGEALAAASFLHDGIPVQLRAYRVFVPHDGIATPYTLTEHSEYRWVDIDDVPRFDFVDSDLLLYPEVKEYVLAQR